MLIHPVILCGGSGTRLWPLSREQHPKQLLVLLGERTMLQDTVLRLDGAADVAAPTAKVTRGEDVFIVGENESTYIPLEMIEVQSGPYLGEDDIVRFDDRYRR